MITKKQRRLFSVSGVFALGFFVFWGSISVPNVEATSGAWENVGTSILGSNGGYPMLAFNPLTYEPHIVYRDNTNNLRATVKKFDGSSWSDVGTPGMSYASASYTQIALSSSGDPYVSYRDNARSGKASVLKYQSDTNWQYVGEETFSDGGVSYLRLAFNPLTDEPYAAYADNSWQNLVVVKKFNGSSWENVGNPGVSEGSIITLSLAFNPSTGEPYLAYGDSVYSNKAVVKKWNGSSWETVGTAGFSSSDAGYIAIAFHPETFEPYVVFEDGTDGGYKATVMKFTGSSWEYVGNPRFTTDSAWDPSIAFCPSTNEPYIAFGDESQSSKASVMKFNGSGWSLVGSAGFSEGDAILGNSLVFDPFTKEPFLTFVDGGGSGSQIVVWKYDKAVLSPAVMAYSAKKTKRKLNFTFQDMNRSIKKSKVTIRINGKKLKLSRARKSGLNTIVSGTLNHKNWARGSYDAVISMKYKIGRTTRTKTWTSENALTIE